MFRNVLLFAVLALALPGAAFADSGNAINFNGGSFRPQPTFHVSSDFRPGGSFLPLNANSGFGGGNFIGSNAKNILNSNRGYFNGFTYTFGHTVVPTPEPGSLAFLAISLLAFAFAFRKKLKLQTSN
jgi:PEP-CTERM motif-containing protein